MHKTLRLKNTQLIIPALVLVLLACGSLDRLQDLNQKGRVLATGIAIIDEGNFLAFEAYEKLKQLPGYRLQSRSTLRDDAGNLSTQMTTSSRDSRGNVHILTQTPDGQTHEIYVVDGHTYVFDTQYNGWIDLKTIPPTEAEARYNAVAGLNQTEKIMQLLPQFGAIPTETGQETFKDRPVTRYDLDYITADLAKAFGNQLDAATDLYGTLWIDDQTGALLRSEILLFEAGNRQPRQEFVMEADEIGQTDLVVAPAPVINPLTVAEATVTAQAWLVLQAKINYNNQPVSFELVPVKIEQVSHQENSNAEMHLILRELSATVPLETDVKPFLTLVGDRLSLSVPQHNQVVNSNGFRVEDIDFERRSIEVVYLFDTQLADFSHVELILTGSGNPIFAPVPVVDNK